MVIKGFSELYKNAKDISALVNSHVKSLSRGNLSDR